MNIEDRMRMATPPAPQPRSLRRLRHASTVLLPLSAFSVALVPLIRRISIYAVVPVVFIMLASVITAALYWYRRNRLEKAYWTPLREAAHVDAAVQSIDDRQAARAVAALRAQHRRNGWTLR